MVGCAFGGDRKWRLWDYIFGQISRAKCQVVVVSRG